MMWVSDASKLWEWVLAILANHFMFREETCIRFFGHDRGGLTMKDDKLRSEFLERGEIYKGVKIGMHE